MAGSGKPSTREEGEGRTKRLVYDDNRPDGAAAVKLIIDLKAAKTGSVPAPWRQTAGSGGEFGKVAWYKTLVSAFPTSTSPPEFQLWQLALADHVVREAFVVVLPTVVSLPHMSPPRSQMETLLFPTNKKAVGLPEQGHVGRAAFTDTEKGVKVWMERLKTALKDANPPPVDVQEAGKPPVRIEFTITDFSAAAAAAAAP